jgi:hypothetical protein
VIDSAAAARVPKAPTPGVRLRTAVAQHPTSKRSALCQWPRWPAPRTIRAGLSRVSRAADTRHPRGGEAARPLLAEARHPEGFAFALLAPATTASARRRSAGRRPVGRTAPGSRRGAMSLRNCRDARPGRAQGDDRRDPGHHPATYGLRSLPTGQAVRGAREDTGRAQWPGDVVTRRVTLERSPSNPHDRFGHDAGRFVVGSGGGGRQWHRPPAEPALRRFRHLRWKRIASAERDLPHLDPSLAERGIPRWRPTGALRCRGREHANAHMPPRRLEARRPTSPSHPAPERDARFRSG